MHVCKTFAWACVQLQAALRLRGAGKKSKDVVRPILLRAKDTIERFKDLRTQGSRMLAETTKGPKGKAKAKAKA